MADLVNTPQFRFPMQISAAGEILTVEQDSFEDRVQNAIVCLRYQRGQRTQLPEFGIPDQALRQGGASHREIVESIIRWEPDISPDDLGQIISSDSETTTVRIDLTSPGVHDEGEQMSNG